MKRKAFRTSGGKDRKAKKDKFVFTASDEEDSLPETVTEPEPSESVQDMPCGSDTLTDAPNAAETAPDMPHHDEIVPNAAETVSDVPHPNENVSDGLQETETEKICSANMQETIMIAPKVQETEEPENHASNEEHAVQAPPEPDMTYSEQSEKFNKNPSPQQPAEKPKLQEAPLLPEPEVECDPNAPLPTFYNGPNLAEIRKRCGIKLRSIWEETKIPIRTLEDIESEKYEALPPEVYIRSFIATYAKFLSLDPKKAVKDYMERYHIWKIDYEKQQKRKSSLFSFGKKSSSFFGIKIKKS